MAAHCAERTRVTQETRTPRSFRRLLIVVAATLALAPMFHDRPFVVHGLTMTLALVLSGLVFSATRSRLLTGVGLGLAVSYEWLSQLAVDPGVRAVGAAASGCF